MRKQSALNLKKDNPFTTRVLSRNIHRCCEGSWRGHKEIRNLINPGNA